MPKWLGDCVKGPMTEIQTLEQMMADDATNGFQEDMPGISPGEAERIVHEMLTREYRETLDSPVPALDHMTPRALSRTIAGRTKVADWLKYIENGSKKTGPDNPIATYDFTWMWHELGLIELRR